MKKLLIALLIIFVIGTLGYFTYRRYFNVNNSVRQAVFMTNGQVYFGYVSNPASQIVTLKDVYYLRTQDLNSDNSDDKNKKIMLIKLGSELHRPDNIMYINRDQILYIQDLQNDSRINDAIKRFVSSSPNK